MPQTVHGLAKAEHIRAIALFSSGWKIQERREISKMDLPVIESERLVLRMCPPDVEAIVAYYMRNRRHLREFTPVREENYYTLSYWNDQLTKNTSEFENGQSVRLFMLEKPESQTVIGAINFSNIVRNAAQFAHLGYDLDEKKQGNGYMTEGLKGAIAYAFSDLNLHRINANYMPTNERSGKVLRRLGFVVDGYARDYLRINGEWRDHIMTSLTNPAWKEG